MAVPTPTLVSAPSVTPSEWTKGKGGLRVAARDPHFSVPLTSFSWVGLNGPSTEPDRPGLVVLAMRPLPLFPPPISVT